MLKVIFERLKIKYSWRFGAGSRTGGRKYRMAVFSMARRVLGQGVCFGNTPSKAEVINDIDGELINLFRCIRTHPEELADAGLIFTGDVNAYFTVIHDNSLYSFEQRLLLNVSSLLR